MIKFSKKSKKKLGGGGGGGKFRPFSLNLVKNEFSSKRGLCQFLNIPIIYHVKYKKKKQKKNKLMSHS